MESKNYKYKQKFSNNSNRNKQNGGTFTHFISVPFISVESRSILKKFQDQILDCFQQHEKKALIRNNPNLFHITLSMLTLNNANKVKASQIMDQFKKSIIQNLNSVKFSFSGVNFFKRGRSPNPYYGVTVLYLELIQDENYIKLMKTADMIIRQFIKSEIIPVEDLKSMNISYNHNQGLYKPDKMHLTMFRIDQNEGRNVDFEKGILKAKTLKGIEKLNVQTVDISTRFQYDITRFYNPLKRIELLKQALN